MLSFNTCPPQRAAGERHRCVRRRGVRCWNWRGAQPQTPRRRWLSGSVNSSLRSVVSLQLYLRLLCARPWKRKWRLLHPGDGASVRRKHCFRPKKPAFPRDAAAFQHLSPPGRRTVGVVERRASRPHLAVQLVLAELRSGQYCAAQTEVNMAILCCECALHHTSEVFRATVSKDSVGPMVSAWPQSKPGTAVGGATAVAKVQRCKGAKGQRPGPAGSAHRRGIASHPHRSPPGTSAQSRTPR